MKPLTSISALSAIALTFALTSCGPGRPAGPPPNAQNATVSISPHLASIPAGATVTFTATVTNASVDTLSWLVFNPIEATVGNPNPPKVNVGSPESQRGGATFVYTAPPTPPIYTDGLHGPDDGGHLIQGIVSLGASVPVPIPNTLFGGSASDGENIVITAPSITVGVSPANGATPTVAVNKMIQFIGYAIGSVNNAITWQINGVTGGSTATGTIVHNSNDLPERADYTAPSTIPMSGNTVTLTVISQADPSKTASVVITITPQ